MGIVRRAWVWKNPVTKKRKKIWHSPDFVRVLEAIEEPEEAEAFFEAYEKVAPPDLAEHNLAYHIALIRDPDIREDAADLFMINLGEHGNGNGGICPEHVFHNHHGGSSLGLKFTSEEARERDEAARSRKATKFKKARV
jgi:hypothetical protein